MGIDFSMTANVMTGVDEPSLTGSYPTGKGNGVIDGLMAVVWHFTEGIDDKHISTLKIREFSVVDGLHIGNVSKGTYAIAKDRQVVVHHFNRHDVEVANSKRLVLVNLVQLDGRHARIAVFCKTVWQHLEHALTGYGVGIDVDFAKLAVRPDIVHSAHVVVVGMGDEYAVNLTERLHHDLLAEVWTAVNEQARAVGLDECRTAQTLVVRVGAATCVALAADGRHATRCSCSKKCHTHLRIYYLLSLT